MNDWLAALTRLGEEYSAVATQSLQVRERLSCAPQAPVAA